MIINKSSCHLLPRFIERLATESSVLDLRNNRYFIGRICIFLLSTATYDEIDVLTLWLHANTHAYTDPCKRWSAPNCFTVNDTDQTVQNLFCSAECTCSPCLLRESERKKLEYSSISHRHTHTHAHTKSHKLSHSAQTGFAVSFSVKMHLNDNGQQGALCVIITTHLQWVISALVHMNHVSTSYTYI